MPSLASKKLSKFLQAIWMLNLQMVLSYFFNLNIFFPKLAHLLILNLFYYIQSPLDYKESNQSVLKQSILNTHWKDSCWSCSSNILTTWCEELTHLKRSRCWERLKAVGEGYGRRWRGCMASLTKWTWVAIQSLSPVRLFATPWTAALEASLFITNSWSLLKLVSIESVMPFNHIILCLPLLLPPLNLSQHQGLFQWVGSLHQVAKVLEFQLQYSSFQWIFRTDFL